MTERILNYVGRDGLLHILCSIVLVGVIDIVLPLWDAIVSTAFMGLAKEIVLVMWLVRGTLDWKDLLCDLAGIAIGAL